MSVNNLRAVTVLSIDSYSCGPCPSLEPADRLLQLPIFKRAALQRPRRHTAWDAKMFSTIYISYWFMLKKYPGARTQRGENSKRRRDSLSSRVCSVSTRYFRILHASI